VAPTVPAAGVIAATRAIDDIRVQSSTIHCADWVNFKLFSRVFMGERHLSAQYRLPIEAIAGDSIPQSPIKELN
jgi:hypothetical protein